MRMMYIWLTIDLIYISSSLNSFGVMSYITFLSYCSDLTGLIRSHSIYIYIYIYIYICVCVCVCVCVC
jgi:membrane associated rhomboid family serine protease